LPRRSERQAAPAAEPDAPEPCTRAAARSAERSCAGPEAAGPLASRQLEPRAERSLKRSEVRTAPQEAQPAVPLGGPGAGPRSKIRAPLRLAAVPEVSKESPGRKERKEPLPRELLEFPLPASGRQGRPLSAGSRPPEALPASLQESAQPAHGLRVDAARAAGSPLPSAE
jgi:hypothetical protein